MIGSAIGGDGNCVNGVIITNLEAISSRPDQSEDAPPFPEPGPFLPFLVSDPFLATVIEFLSSSFSNPESHSPRHRRRRRRRRRCISVVVSLCDTRKFTLVPFRLHPRTSRFFCLVPRFVWRSYDSSLSLSFIARNDYLVRWGGTTSGNLRRRSFLAFARNNDLFYDDDSLPLSTLSLSLSLPICTPHRPREWLLVPNFNQTWPNFRTSGMAIRHIISLVLGDFSLISSLFPFPIQYRDRFRAIHLSWPLILWLVKRSLPWCNIWFSTFFLNFMADYEYVFFVFLLTQHDTLLYLDYCIL